MGQGKTELETKSRGTNQIKNTWEKEELFIHLPQVEHRVGVMPLNSWAHAVHTRIQLEHRENEWLVRGSN